MPSVSNSTAVDATAKPLRIAHTLSISGGRINRPIDGKSTWVGKANAAPMANAAKTISAGVLQRWADANNVGQVSRRVHSSGMAVTSTPSRSPIHHLRLPKDKSSGLSRPATASQAQPLAAVNTELPTPPATTTRQMSRRWSRRRFRPLRLSHCAATQAAPILPKPISKANHSGASELRLTSTEPTNNAGICALPQRTNTAKARPNAGQNRLMYGDSVGNAKPSRPAAQ